MLANYTELRFVFGMPKSSGWYDYTIRKWLESDWQIDASGYEYGKVVILLPDSTIATIQMRKTNGFLFRCTGSAYTLRAVYARKY